MGLFGKKEPKNAPLKTGTPETNEALFVACEDHDLKLIQKLLKKGASPDSTSKDGVPCMYAPARWNYPDIVRLLLENGANPNAADKWGQTVLGSAIEEGNREIVKLLLEYKADVNKKSYDRTPLQMAMRNLDLETAEMLLQNGAEFTEESIIEGLAPVGFLESSISISENLSAIYSRFNARVGSLSQALYSETVRFIKNHNVNFESGFKGVSLENLIIAKIATSKNIVDTAGTARKLINMLKNC